MSWLSGTRARLRLIFGRSAAESRMEREFSFHVDMEAERLLRDEGLDPHEARRRALVAFGGIEKHKEELRSDRGLAWLSAMSLDLKLGVRMLVKYPGLAIVAVIGMAVAVAIGAVTFRVLYSVADPTVPLDQGHQVIAIENIDPRNQGAAGTHLRDLATWREEATAIAIVGGYRTLDRNLITTGGRVEPVRVAEMSASGFQLARVPPLMGRHFNEGDEQEGAPAVVVIAHSVWKSRFAERPDIIGQRLQLGATPHTIIGVMPESFAFPVNNRIWTPLRLNPSHYERGKAPPLDVFGRLAPTATIEDAETQLRTIAARLTAAYPATYEHIRPRVLPYARSFLDSPQLVWVFHVAQFLISMLLVVIGTNVAVLVYARTASRIGEIAVRSALGASRARIVAQLFAEALVLSVAAAMVGLIGAHFTLDQVSGFIERIGGEQIPFWMDFEGLSPGLILYVAGLAVLAAVIVGVLPALKATRRDVHVNLQQLGAGGSGMRLGKTWTVLIVTQVAIAVAVLPLALRGVGTWVIRGIAEPEPATREILTASVSLDREGIGTDDEDVRGAELTARFVSLRAELVRRLEADPRVSQVVLTSAIPGEETQLWVDLERGLPTSVTDTAVGRGALGHLVRAGRVEPDFFEALDIPVLVGRGFAAADATVGATPVVVNQSFVERVLRGGPAIGRRVRYMERGDGGHPVIAPTEPWREIVGVVPDYPRMVADPSVLGPQMYEPMHAGDPRPGILSVRLKGTTPAAFADRLRDHALAVDPMLRLVEVGPLDQTLRDSMQMNRLISIVVGLLTLSVILLSAAGIYALMSFTITKRRREIGIRTALGAGARNVLWSVLSKSMGQIGIGIAVGIGIAALMQLAAGRGISGPVALLLAGVAALMSIVGLTAAIGPARQALRIQPTEALKGDG
jgi:predicted permease